MWICDTDQFIARHGMALIFLNPCWSSLKHLWFAETYIANIYYVVIGLDSTHILKNSFTPPDNFTTAGSSNLHVFELRKPELKVENQACISKSWKIHRKTSAFALPQPPTELPCRPLNLFAYSICISILLHQNLNLPKQVAAHIWLCSWKCPQTRLLNKGPDAAFLMQGFIPCCSHDNFRQTCAEILIISEEYELKSSSHVCCVFQSAAAESSHGLFPVDISSVFRLQFLDTIKHTHTHKDLTC